AVDGVLHPVAEALGALDALRLERSGKPLVTLPHVPDCAIGHVVVWARSLLKTAHPSRAAAPQARFGRKTALSRGRASSRRRAGWAATPPWLRPRGPKGNILRR